MLIQMSGHYLACDAVLSAALEICAEERGI